VWMMLAQPLPHFLLPLPTCPPLDSTTSAMQENIHSLVRKAAVYPFACVMWCSIKAPIACYLMLTTTFFILQPLPCLHTPTRRMLFVVKLLDMAGPSCLHWSRQVLSQPCLHQHHAPPDTPLHTVCTPDWVKNVSSTDITKVLCHSAASFISSHWHPPTQDICIKPLPWRGHGSSVCSG